MSDTALDPFTTAPRPDRIALPDGDHLIPRKAFAARLDVSERTVTRMNLLTVYIGNIAHVKERASLQDLADRARRRHQPQKPRRATA